VKRSVKAIIFIVVLVLVVASYFVVTNLVKRADEKKNASDDVQNETIVLFDGSKTRKISWTYNGETVTLVDRGDDWKIENNYNFPVSDTYTTALEKVVCKKLSTSRWIDDPADMEEYGLTDDYACVITLTTEKDESITFRTGKINASTGKCYAKVDGDERIYLLDATYRDAFEYTQLQLVPVEEIPALTNVYGFEVKVGNKSVCYELITLSNAITTSDKKEQKWVRQVDGFGAATYVDADPNSVGKMMTVIGTFAETMAWSECADIDVRDDELELYGFDAPQCEVSLRYYEDAKMSTGEYNEDGSSIMETVTFELTRTFTFGDNSENGCYATSTDTNRCYIADQEIVNLVLSLEGYLFEE